MSSLFYLKVFKCSVAEALKTHLNLPMVDGNLQPLPVYRFGEQCLRVSAYRCSSAWVVSVVVL